MKQRLSNNRRKQGMMFNLKVGNSVLRKIEFAAIFGLGLAISGCASKTAEVEEYSGFLSDYSILQEGKGVDGAVIIGWRSPDMENRNYTKVMIDPVVIYPAPKPTSQIRTEVLTNMLIYMNKKLREEVGKTHEIVSAPGKDVLRVRAAITGTKTTTEALSVYEYVPIALVFSAATTATGTRSQAVEILLEAEVTDSLSGELLSAAIRKGFGDTVSNTSEQVELGNIRPVLDQWVAALDRYLDRELK
jgi:Protein of unknown function (DUF3313)